MEDSPAKALAKGLDIPGTDRAGELIERLAKAKNAQSAAELATLERMQLVHRRARAAAARLLAARDPFAPAPRTAEQMMALVDHMAKTPKRYGVTLMPYERKAIKLWHLFMRVQRNAKPAADTNPDPKPAEPEPGDRTHLVPAP